MTLAGILKFVGWVFALAPLITFLAISGFMVWGAGKDDGTIMALNMIGITIFLIGVILLVLVYLSGLFDGGVQVLSML